jgi:Tfp pilus assembly protein PilV
VIDNRGQSLIEVVVAVGVMSLLMVALLTTVTLAVKNSRLAKDRVQAVSLANEGVELMRAYRDYDYDEFFSVARIDQYDLPYSWVVEDGLSSDCVVTEYVIRDSFRRCVGITSVDASSVDVEVTVDWQEGSRVHQVLQSTRLTQWER